MINQTNQKEPNIQEIADLLTDIAAELMTSGSHHADYSEYFSHGS